MPKTALWVRIVLVSSVLGSLVAAACAPKSSPPPAASAPLTSAPAAPLAAPGPAQPPSAWDGVVAAAKKEGTLTVYGSAFVGDISRRISREFEKQYGIRLEVLAGGGNQLLEKIRVEQKIGKPIGDIMGSSGGSISQLVIDGLGAGTARELPALADKSVFETDPAFSPGGEILAFAWDVSPTIINTNLIKPQDEPRAWAEFLEPRWKGKILTPDPRTTGSTAFYYSLRFFKIIDLDYLRKLAKQEMTMWSGNNREAIKMVARGEYPVYLFGPMDGVAPLVAEGAPVKPLAMKEGNAASMRGITAVKNSSHPNAAKLFLNWMLSPEGQKAFHQEARMKPIRKDVPDFSIPQARFEGAKIIYRTWEAEEWSDKDMKAKTMMQVFGEK